MKPSTFCVFHGLIAVVNMWPLTFTKTDGKMTIAEDLHFIMTKIVFVCKTAQYFAMIHQAFNKGLYQVPLPACNDLWYLLI